MRKYEKQANGDINMKLEPRKRTAIDGEIWWCVYDRELNKYSTLLCFGKYKTKAQCDAAILYFQKGYKHGY